MGREVSGGVAVADDEAEGADAGVERGGEGGARDGGAPGEGEV